MPMPAVPTSMPMPSYGLGGGKFQIVNHLGVLVFAKVLLQPFF
jgi:hypothetical protein